jgi:hypothetical protein
MNTTDSNFRPGSIEQVSDPARFPTGQLWKTL